MPKLNPKSLVLSQHGKQYASFLLIVDLL